MTITLLVLYMYMPHKLALAKAL